VDGGIIMMISLIGLAVGFVLAAAMVFILKEDKK